jgi:hypothetical protein
MRNCEKLLNVKLFENVIYRHLIQEPQIEKLPITDKGIATICADLIRSTDITSSMTESLLYPHGSHH